MYYFYEPGAGERSQPGKYKGEEEEGKGGLVEHIRDSYTSLQAVSQAICRAGLRRARVVLGIDLTASNEWQGRITFNSHSLHRLHPVRSVIAWNCICKIVFLLTIVPRKGGLRIYEGF